MAETWRARYQLGKKWPKITLVNTSLNQGIYLERCIVSIISQGYPNLEYFIMDGGSTDHSINVIKKYQKYITYWRSCKDSGPSGAVMEGFRMGTGEIMCWLASDDVHQGPALFKIAMLFMAYPEVEWIVGIPTVINDEDEIIFAQTEFPLSHAELLNISNMLNGKFIGADGVFWRRRLWEKAGPYFTDGPANDYDLWIRFARHAKLYFVPDIFSSYRLHNLSSSFNNKKKYLADALNSVKREVSHLEKADLTFFQTPYPHLPPIYKDYLPLHPVCGSLRPRQIELDTKKPLGPSLDMIKNSLTEWEAHIDSLLDSVESFYKDSKSPHGIILANMDKLDLITFDCFDTLLYRFCDKPHRLFYEVARRLREKNILKENVDGVEFCSLRQKAEEIARNNAYTKRKSRECHLIEIYSELRNIISDWEQAVEVELGVEKSFCFLNPSLADLAIFLKNKGKKIGIISDTYLSSEHIRSILRHNSFPVHLLDFIVTSCEVGVNKSSGLLYRYVERKFKINRSKWLHIGDNYEADIGGAKKAGIYSFFYAKYTDTQAKTLWKEELLENVTGKSASFNAFRAISCNNTNLIPERYRGYFEIGAFFLGPIIGRFIDWCVDVCQKEHVEAVLFLMREGHMLLPMFRMLTKEIGYEVPTEIFYVSRYSVWLADLYEFTPQALFSRLDHKRPTLRNILSSLKLPVDEIKNYFNISLDKILSDEERLYICRKLLEDDSCRKKLNDQIEHKRANLLCYIKQLTKNKARVALVDVGFRGVIQGVIDTLLKRECIACKTIGIYLATRVEAAEKVISGSEIRSIWGKLGGSSNEVLPLTKHPEILEIALNSTCGTTIGYTFNSSKNVWEPILEEKEGCDDIILKSYYMKVGILEFYKIWLQFYVSRFKERNLLDRKLITELNEQCKTIMKRLWVYPTKDEAELLGTLFHEDNLGTSAGNELCDAEARKAYRENGVQALLEKIVYWPNGVIAGETPELFENFFSTRFLAEHI